jgi:predicted phage-related endonuclease
MGDAEAAYAGEYKITWKTITSSKIDTAALKKALPEVVQAFTRETTTRRFIVA